jgi:peptidoglycan hydrolase CwlO-like protein
MKSKLLIFLLILSLVANVYFVFLSEEQPSIDKGQIQEMQTSINKLQKENGELQAKINQDNQSLKSYAPQLKSYREKFFELGSNSKTSNSRFEQKHMWKTVKFFNIS